MTSPVRSTPHGRWIVIAVVVVLLGWLFVARVVDSLTVEQSSAIETRNEVRDRLGPAEGPPIALPVILPAGYRLGEDYQYSENLEGHVESRSVMFMTTEDGGADDNLRGVGLCIEDADEPTTEHNCGAGRDAIVRVIGPVRVVIGTSGHAATRTIWERVELTTNLNKVTWLH